MRVHPGPGDDSVGTGEGTGGAPAVTGIAGPGGHGVFAADRGTGGAIGGTKGDPQAPAATVCGFVVPTAAATGLPNRASYDTSDPNVVVDQVTGLVWARSVSAVSMSVAEASAACAASQLDGQSDWRLPSVVELASIIDVTVPTGETLIDAAAFPNTPAAPFWSSQARAGKNFREQWFVNFRFPQLSFTMGTIFANRARCVRTGPTPAARCSARDSRYQVTGATVLDALTGLVWQRVADDASVTFETARASCAASSDGFRLPTVQELLTLVDYTVVENSVNPTPPMLDTVAFPGTPAESFWASSSPLSETGSPYSVNFGNGLVVSDGGKPAGASALVEHSRCVR